MNTGKTACWPYFDPEYENLSQRINPPRVVIENLPNEKCTLVKVDSANKHGILLEVVQVLTELGLVISKAYISSDGSWFMDVFHVTDRHGNKVNDETLIQKIQQVLCAPKHNTGVSDQTVGVISRPEFSAIELTGSDRPGLLSEISAVLTVLKCNVVAAQMWTHNTRVACLVYVTGQADNGPIKDAGLLKVIEEQLSNIMKGSDGRRVVNTDFLIGLPHTDRRLHQLLFADRDYEKGDLSNDHGLSLGSDGDFRPRIMIENCAEKGYSIVNIQCRDRPKLLFDAVCTLTDMQYVVSHAIIDCDGPWAMQEYYIRHIDGCTLNTECERQRVIDCLVSAIERRTCQGTRLELCTGDKVGLLSEITQIFRENGLRVKSADVNTKGNLAIDEFFLTNASGGPADSKTIEAVRKEIGHVFQVKVCNFPKKPEPDIMTTRSVFSFANLIKSQWEWLSSNLCLIRS